jgi:hypothetical protein
MKVTREEIIRLQKECKTDKAIGERVGLGKNRIQQLRAEYGIAPVIPAACHIEITKEDLIRLQKELTTDRAIGHRLGVTGSAITLRRKKFGISRTKEYYSKKGHQSRVKQLRSIAIDKYPVGTRRIDRCSGKEYWKIKIDNQRWVFEHRHVMQIRLGRKLLKTEFVHHRDGNSLNNSIGNLEIVAIGKHNSIHKRLNGAWSKISPDGCLKCGRNTVHHAGYGLCARCLSRVNR